MGLPRAAEPPFFFHEPADRGAADPPKARSGRHFAVPEPDQGTCTHEGPFLKTGFVGRSRKPAGGPRLKAADAMKACSGAMRVFRAFRGHTGARHAGRSQEGWGPTRGHRQGGFGPFRHRSGPIRPRRPHGDVEPRATPDLRFEGTGHAAASRSTIGKPDWSIAGSFEHPSPRRGRWPRRPDLSRARQKASPRSSTGGHRFEGGTCRESVALPGANSRAALRKPSEGKGSAVRSLS